MPSSSFAPQYWEKNSMPPPTKPQYPLNISEENWAQSPTAPTCVGPREAIIIVSTMDPVVVSRFCSATGTAITATFFRKSRQGKRAFSTFSSSAVYWGYYRRGTGRDAMGTIIKKGMPPGGIPLSVIGFTGVWHQRPSTLSLATGPALPYRPSMISSALGSR